MLKLTFYGGAQDVTGANHFLETGKKKVLIDCGLFQGSKTCEDRNWAPFAFDPKEVDALFVTHGHLDHIGRIPKLVKDGFNGRIFSTYPTRDFSELMLIDSLGVLTKEAKKSHQKPFYQKQDVQKAMELWEPVEYDEQFKLGDLKVTFREAGHILGSAVIEMEAEGKKLVFTGDLGNPPTPLLKKPYKISKADFLIIESTYGDRTHEGKEERKLKLERVIEDTLKRKGVLMVPAFSIERTQELLFELNDLVENGHIPKTPIFLDSPLAIQATEIYKRYEKYYNKEAKYIIRSGDDVFKFPGLEFTLTTQDSKRINGVTPPKIIIAGSGMSNGGRIIHHERRYLPDPNSTLLLVCYQAVGSLGRTIKEGAKLIKILGEDIPVEANIESIEGYSAHPDTDGLFNYVKGISGLERVFVVQGELKATSFFAQRIRDYLGINTCSPALEESFVLKQ
jgi:metallo-beta-lactamase family protein